MITREFLLERGFKQDICAPSSVEDYFKKENPQCGYVSVRFKGDIATGLYAYSENKHVNIRKVVLSDTTVTNDDFDFALKICRL